MCTFFFGRDIHASQCTSDLVCPPAGEGRCCLHTKGGPIGKSRGRRLFASPLVTRHDHLCMSPPGQTKGCVMHLAWETEGLVTNSVQTVTHTRDLTAVNRGGTWRGVSAFAPWAAQRKDSNMFSFSLWLKLKINRLKYFKLLILILKCIRSAISTLIISVNSKSSQYLACSDFSESVCQQIQFW